jgi:hypothetical protein
MRRANWRWLGVAVLILGIAGACGRSDVRSFNVVPEPDAGPDAGADAGSDAGPDAGPDAGLDAGHDAGPDAGPPDAGPPDAGPPDAGPPDAGPPPVMRWGTIVVVPDGDGWTFASDGLPSGAVMGASADEGGNIWVAGGSAGVFVQPAGRTSFRGFGIGDGLHPYGFLHGQVARDYGVPDGYPADRSPSLAETPVVSVSGGPPDTAFVGYQGKPGCEDEWDRFGETLADHEKANPAIYKSGDADRVSLSGGGIAVSHFDIYSGEGVVGNEPLGREKLCTVHRILYDHGTNRVWLGANHGFALGFADTAAVWEHVHPGINDIHGYMMTDAYYGIALDAVPHSGPLGTTVFDVWFGGMIRTTRFRFGEVGGDYWKAQPKTELYATIGPDGKSDAADISKDPVAQAAYWNRMDVWPDPIGERWDPAHGDWHSREPDAKNPADWNYDNVTGIAAMKGGDAWVGSFTNGLRHLDHDGQLIGDATQYLPSRQLGAVVRDPTDESVWIGYRDGKGVTRMMPDGSMLQYSGAALGANAGSAVWDIQIDTAGARRKVIVAFRRGAVGVYSGP